MKRNLAMMSLLMLIIFSACDKVRPVPGGGGQTPGETDLQRTFRFTFNDPTGQPDALDNLTALVSMTNLNNEVVYTSKVLSIDYSQKYRTAVLTLNKGNYRLTGFIIKQGDKVKFAAPIAGSSKAPLVQSPLSITVALDEKNEKQINVDMLAVGDKERPQQYGYPEGSFGNIPNEGEEQPMDKKIFIKPLIKIGDIVYDSVPVQLVMRSWDAEGNMFYSAFNFPAGMQSVTLPRTAVRYKLSISKWNTYDELELTKAEVQENTVYIMGGYKPAKKIRNVFLYKTANGSTVPLTKSVYEYEPDGKLKKNTLFAKRADNSSYIQMTRLFEYNNSKISKISSLNEQNVISATSTFAYDNNGRVISMQETSNATTTEARVFYAPINDETSVPGDHSVNIEYTYQYQTYKTYHTKHIHGAVAISDVTSTEGGGREEGLYAHDFEINPYAHMNIPDLFLTNYSRHNLKRQWKTYYLLEPAEEPYEYSYIYDADGFPTQMLVKYRSLKTKEYIYTLKTVFEY